MEMDEKISILLSCPLWNWVTEN